MRVFVTGGTGFVGRQLCQQLCSSGHEVLALVRPGSEKKLVAHPSLVPLSIELFDPTLSEKLKGCDAVIHLVGIIREFPGRGVTFRRLHVEATEAVVTATQRAGISRYLHMSANGTREDAVSNYHRTKWRAECIVRQSNLDWTIFRPSLIYGEEDQFINMLAGFIRRLPAVPVMGDGKYQMQPVSVEQVATGFVAALSEPATIGKTYHCGGADCVSYNALLDAVGDALGKSRVCKVKQPLFLMRPMVSLLESFSFFPMTSDQLQMLTEGNCCDARDWWRDLDLSPEPLETGLDYLKKA